MKANFRIKVVLTGLKVGRMFFHHEPEKMPCAEFYFSPIRDRVKLETEPVIMRCVAYGDVALLLKAQGHRFLRLTGRIISDEGNPKDNWLEKDYLLVESVKFGDAALQAKHYNYASCHGVCHYDSYSISRDSFVLRGIDRLGDHGGMYCMMNRRLLKEEMNVVLAKKEVTVIGELRTQMPADADDSVSLKMEAGSCFMILGYRMLLSKKR